VTGGRGGADFGATILPYNGISPRIAEDAFVAANCSIIGDDVHSLKQGTYIGREVTVGHMALIHAATLEDGAFVGMGAIVLDGAVVEGGALLAAGALLAPGKRVPRGELWAGRPARLVRKLTPEDLAGFDLTVETYAKRAQTYLAERRARGA
jgi:carbonic anhydrase/acetyltransferase-like protein (isoleucine patch superfamily)